MAITPISSDTNSNRASVVSQMLNRGGRTLSQMLGAAIQLGRNTADNQFRQEQAFLTEQRREINLNQRRAENVRQDEKDAVNFLESKRRFDTKFGQDERFQEDRLQESAADRAIRLRQVEGGLALGGERNDIARTNSATSIFNAETSRRSAEAGIASSQRRDELATRQVQQQEAEAAQSVEMQQRRQDFSRRFADMSPEQRKEAYFKEGVGLGFDATDRRTFAAEAGIGTTRDQLDQIDALPPDRKAQALGLVDSLQELEERRAIGVSETNPATGAKEYKRLSPEEFNQRRNELEAELSKVLSGSRSTADGIFKRAQERTRE